MRHDYPSATAAKLRAMLNLIAAEALELEAALALDSGTLGETLADRAHAVAYQADTTARDLRRLAGAALALARRYTAAAELAE